MNCALLLKNEQAFKERTSQDTKLEFINRFSAFLPNTLMGSGVCLNGARQEYLKMDKEILGSD